MIYMNQRPRPGGTYRHSPVRLFICNRVLFCSCRFEVKSLLFSFISGSI